MSSECANAKSNPGKDVLNTCKRLAELGVANANGGNVSVRLAANRILITATGVCLREMSADDLVTVDSEGRKLHGNGQPSMETMSHLRLYQERPDLNGMIHCHPPAATAWALARRQPPLEAFCEGYYLVGRVELLVPYQTPVDLPALLKKHAANANGFLLSNHGLLMGGPDLRTALLRVETYELLCRAAIDSITIGGDKSIEPDKLSWLEDMHNKTFPR